MQKMFADWNFADWNMEVFLRNRSLVRNAVGRERSGECMYSTESSCVIGCCFLPDGRYRKYYLKNNPENLARFICSSEELKILCNSSDEAIACTMGSYMDLAVFSLQKLLLPYLEECQSGRGLKEFECID